MDTQLKYNEPWILQRADPFICRQDNGKYYFTASVPAYDRIILRCADTLAGIADAEEVTIWHKHESGPMSENIWAPELHKLDGKWYVYYAGGEKEDMWNIRPYVLECADEDPMTGTWRELGMMQCADEDEFSFRAFSLDATVFEDHGKRYYVWAEKVGVGRQISNLYIAEMETPNKLKTVQVLLTTPDYDWERVGFWVNEGPAVIKRDGKFFSPTLQVRQGRRTVWECSRLTAAQTCSTRYHGRRSAIRCWLPILRSRCTVRGTIPLPWTRREMIFSCIMPARRA